MYYCDVYFGQYSNQIICIYTICITYSVKYILKSTSDTHPARLRTDSASICNEQTVHEHYILLVLIFSGAQVIFQRGKRRFYFDLIPDKIISFQDEYYTHRGKYRERSGSYFDSKWASSRKS